MEPLEGSSFPIRLECGSPMHSLDLPSWGKQTFRVPYDWAVCEGEPKSLLDVRKCYDKQSPIGDYFEHTVLPNGTPKFHFHNVCLFGFSFTCVIYLLGTLIIHELTKPWRPLGIICSSALFKNKVYSAYFQNNNGRAAPFTYTHGSYPNQIVAKSPTFSRVEFRSGWVSLPLIYLFASYPIMLVLKPLFFSHIPSMPEMLLP